MEYRVSGECLPWVGSGPRHDIVRLQAVLSSWFFVISGHCLEVGSALRADLASSGRAELMTEGCTEDCVEGRMEKPRHRPPGAATRHPK